LGGTVIFQLTLVHIRADNDQAYYFIFRKWRPRHEFISFGKGAVSSRTICYISSETTYIFYVLPAVVVFMSFCKYLLFTGYCLYLNPTLLKPSERLKIKSVKNAKMPAHLG